MAFFLKGLFVKHIGLLLPYFLTNFTQSQYVRNLKFQYVARGFKTFRQIGVITFCTPGRGGPMN